MKTMRESCPQSANKRRQVAKPKVKSNFFLVLYHVTFLRSFVKWIMRKITGACELQRIVRKYKYAERNEKLEQCMLMSKSAVIRNAIGQETDVKNVSKTVASIMKIKDIIPEMDPPFEPALTTSLLQIKGYKMLFEDVESLRKEAYDCENAQHEELLIKLWGLLKPEQKLENRVCKSWCQLGFQGSDPKTDFRGMGILGLKCMVYFAENHSDKARQILQHSLHPVQGYSYAIVSINITSLMCEMLQSGQLRTHFYYEVSDVPKISDFLHAFSCAFCQFDKYWFDSKPENVMAFNRIRESFALELGIHLSCPYYGSLRMDDQGQ